MTVVSPFFFDIDRAVFQVVRTRQPITSSTSCPTRFCSQFSIIYSNKTCAVSVRCANVSKRSPTTLKYGKTSEKPKNPQNNNIVPHYRKRLYQNVYEYDLPLFNPGPCAFQFVTAEESDLANPWKESFRQLYRGIHVRPGYQELSFSGRNLVYFNTIQAALDYADERSSAANNASATTAATSTSSEGTAAPTAALIFLHAGTYRGEFLVIDDSDIALIGAASGNVAESVVLERESESTVMFVEGAKNAYCGHLTLKFSPDVTSTVPHHKHYCLEVGENCSPTVDHCIIRSTSVGKSFFFCCEMSGLPI